MASTIEFDYRLWPPPTKKLTWHTENHIKLFPPVAERLNLPHDVAPPPKKFMDPLVLPEATEVQILRWFTCPARPVSYYLMSYLHAHKENRPKSDPTYDTLHLNERETKEPQVHSETPTNRCRQNYYQTKQNKAFIRSFI